MTVTGAAGVASRAGAARASGVVAAKAATTARVVSSKVTTTAATKVAQSATVTKAVSTLKSAGYAVKPTTSGKMVVTHPASGSKTTLTLTQVKNLASRVRQTLTPTRRAPKIREQKIL